MKHTKFGEFELRKKQKRSGKKYEKMGYVGKRYEQEVLERCELCNIVCNGKYQYEGHINGKRHKIAVIKSEKSM